MDIKELKGIGDKTAAFFNRLSVYTIDDLVSFYPRDYDVYEETVLIGELSAEQINKTVAVEGVIAKSPELFSTQRFKILSSSIRDSTGVLKCTWFNMPFLRNSLKQGMHYVLRGHLSSKNGIYVMEQPSLYTIAQYKQIMGSMQPVYPLTKGLSNKTVIKAVSQALEKYNAGLETEYIPDWIRNRYNLAEHNFSVRSIHFPANMQDYILSRNRLAFEEFFLFVLAVRRLKESNQKRINGYIIDNNRITDEFINNLPFTLTDAQLRAWEEIKNDMSGNGLMSRLVQGDVGSGKTIVAVLALMNTAFAGYQAAMMVPTEVLAKQQFESICEMFEKNNIKLNVELLIGSMTASEKKKAYERIKSGQTHIIIGTHALIQEKVQYNNLALVITDEQHRFGVNQRKDFAQKGNEPHVLVMSATPIPRTLAIIVYGDLDISVINQMPADRLPIKNCVVDESYRTNAYKFIEKQVREGRQAYVICPMVEESENVEAENVVDYADKLKQELPSDIRIEYLHGKMKGSQKNEIMERYAKHDTDVLVSTTVIEVGVNVPNATVMMIENADRFGLAQLHQLRGRVGRGKYQSYCIFVSGIKNKKTKERLDIINKSNDGFKIAEEDLKLRGPGDFFGVRQSGDMEFKIGDIFTDAQVLKNAADAATAIMSEDSQLEALENENLKRKVLEYADKCLDKVNL